MNAASCSPSVRAHNLDPMAREAAWVLALGLPLLACTAESGRAEIADTRLGLADSVKGKLEAVSCDSLMGWAQDGSAPDAALAIELTFDAPLTEKADGAFAAGVKRDDLCQSLGSCAHAFDVAPPLSLYDGAPHGVFVYGDNAAATDRALLDGSGAMMTCAPPVVAGTERPFPHGAPSGAGRRHAVFDAG